MSDVALAAFMVLVVFPLVCGYPLWREDKKSGVARRLYGRDNRLIGYVATAWVVEIFMGGCWFVVAAMIHAVKSMGG